MAGLVEIRILRRGRMRFPEMGKKFIIFYIFEENEEYNEGYFDFHLYSCSMVQLFTYLFITARNTSKIITKIISGRSYEVSWLGLSAFKETSIFKRNLIVMTDDLETGLKRVDSVAELF